MKEKDFQQQIVDLAHATNWLCYHTHDSRRSEPGFPDLVLVHAERAVTLFRELKLHPDTQKRGRPTPEQTQWLSALTEAGNDAKLWRPGDWDEIERTLTGRDR